MAYPAAMTPRQLRTFLAVARTRSFVRAARAVHLAQSSVSDQIQALETALGAQLFVRARQGLVPTPAAEALIPYAEEILALGDEAQAAVRNAGEGEGALAMGALETIAAARLPALLTTFRRDYPAAGLRMKVAGTGDLMAALSAGEIDVAFCFDGGQADPRLVARPVASEPVVLIAPPGVIRPVDQAFTATARGCVYRHISDAARAAASIAPVGPDIEVDSIAAIARMVAAGAGVAVVPRLAVEDMLALGTVAEVPWCNPLPAATLRMVWRRRRVQPKILKAFLASFPA
ncbi:MAG: LysR family transcriptional regulator [Asticcacaulis sp.]|nr:LysR family transcriptional regulator [Asticcacaulis sp.]